MNTDKICIFTDSGQQHMVKILDLPFGKFRDKGKPIDNLCNYDSTKEQIVTVESLQKIKMSVLIFATSSGMFKQVEGAEFDVVKRMIAATKLNEGDELVFVGCADEMEQVVLQSHGGYFLRFLKQELPLQKKTAAGVRGMKLAGDDSIEYAYLLEGHKEYSIEYHEKPYALNKVKLAKRDTKGVKPRI